MKSTITYLKVIALVFFVQTAVAQDTIQKSLNQEKIEALIAQRSKVETQEKEALKKEVEAINQHLANGEITAETAETLKQQAAEKTVKNIENKLIIYDNTIELLKRNEEVAVDLKTSPTLIRIGGSEREETNDDIIFVGKKEDDKPQKYDLRTTSDLVFAFGLNNALVEGESLNDSPYNIGGSRFAELGFAWKTRVFKESNLLRLKYGFSFQFNGLKPNDNQYFVQDGDLTFLEDYPVDLDKSKLSMTNLVFPLHFEFGPSKKIEKEDYFRYSTKNKFKMGLGGYAGFNIGTRQKLKYKVDGERQKDKIKKDYNTNSLVYGLSGYVAFDDVALYLKYDLNPIFKDQTIEQNNISLGLRFDID